MLNFKKYTVITAAALSLCLTTHVSADVNESLQNICTIIKSDDKGELRKKMKAVQSDYNLKLRDYYSGITCGGKSLIKSSFDYNSINTGTVLIKKMPKGDLEEPEHDSEGAILEWASANGKNTELLGVLRDRIE
jgi:hypothetical protein